MTGKKKIQISKAKRVAYVHVHLSELDISFSSKSSNYRITAVCPEEFLINFKTECCRTDNVDTITLRALTLTELNIISNSNQPVPVAARSKCLVLLLLVC